MALLSLNKIVLPRGSIAGTLERDFSYTDPRTGIVKYGVIPYVAFNRGERGQDGTRVITWDKFEFKEDDILKYIHFQDLVNACINNAEDINRRLLPINYGLQPYTPESHIELAKAPFMKLKDNFMDFLKTNKRPELKNLTTKALRRDFNQFVLDRNIYTHGKLKIRYHDNEFLLEYIDNVTHYSSWALVNTEMIESYFQTYNDFRSLISRYHEIILRD